jgi:transcriptional regulator with XRE-family HTH domain
MRMELKDRIKRLRAKRGLSCAQIAMLLGKQEAEAIAWESGMARPDPETLAKLRACFGAGCLSDREADEFAPEGLNSLSSEDKALAKEICSKTIELMSHLQGFEEGRDFSADLLSLLMDLSLCSSFLSSVARSGDEPPESRRAAAIFESVKSVTDMDYRSMWGRLDSAFRSRIPSPCDDFGDFMGLRKLGAERRIKTNGF